MATANNGNNTGNTEMSEEEMNSLYCPITGEMMVDPVLSTDDSITYEKTAIITWLSRPGYEPTSPVTRQPMSISNLFPNRPLKNFIEAKLRNANRTVQTTRSISSEISRNISIDAHLVSPTELLVALQPLSDASEANMLPIDVIYCIDVSGSMSTVASKPAENGECDYLSRLDLVKYSTLAGIMSMGPNDRACIITFSDSSKIKMELTHMNDQGKERAKNVLDSLVTEGCTEMWDGIKKCIEVVKGIDSNRNIDVQFLTDGEPSSTPPMGIAKAFKDHLTKLNLKQSFTFNTIGFGYALKPALLDDIANVGSGLFRHIPDCSMIASTFVNLSAICKSTYLSNSYLSITSNGIKIPELSSHYNNNIGSIMLGQKRELLFTIPKYLVSTDLKIELKVGSVVISSKNIVVNSSHCIPHLPTMTRYKIINALIEATKKNMLELNLRNTKLVFDKLYSDIRTLADDVETSYHDKLKLENYLLDYKSSDSYSGGQIGIAIQQPDWYEKWGASFLYAIASAYYYMQCTNFKDKGIQNFTTALFERNRDKANEVFDSLPAPIPTSAEYTSRMYRSSTPYVAPVMSRYNNSGGSCFSGNGRVKIDNSKVCRVDELKPGQLVMTSGGYTRIKYVIKMRVQGGETSVCILEDNLVIHPYHPVYSMTKWVFPNTIVKEKVIPLDYWYNVVLEDGCGLYINNTLVITLGHGLTENGAFHPYYGTQLVVADLKKMDTDNSHYITFNNMLVERENGLVVRISEGESS
jgi:Mg-chelatase subunit ChlD